MLPSETLRYDDYDEPKASLSGPSALPSVDLRPTFVRAKAKAARAARAARAKANPRVAHGRTAFVGLLAELHLLT